MGHTDIWGRDWHHDKKNDGSDVLTYNDDGLNIKVSMIFPPESISGATEHVVGVLKEVFIGDIETLL